MSGKNKRGTGDSGPSRPDHFACRGGVPVGYDQCQLSEYGRIFCGGPGGSDYCLYSDDFFFVLATYYIGGKKS